MTMMSSELPSDRQVRMTNAEAPPVGALSTDASRTGADLRAARERLGWDLADLAAGLRIRQAYLQALEDGRTADLPGNAYAVGFLRTYASALGLDPGEMTRRFRAEAEGVNRKTKLTFPAPVPERGVPAGAVILVGAILAVGAYVGWYRMSGSSGPRSDAVQAVPAELAPLAQKAAPLGAPSPTVASLQPTMPSGGSPPPATALQSPSADAPAAPKPSVPQQTQFAEIPAVPPTQAAAAVPPAALTQPVPQGPRIVLHATADAWVQVRQKQGSVLLNRILRPGEDWPVPADESDLLLTTGNAGGTELVVDGVASAPLGPSGAVRRDLPLDADLIKNGGLAAKGVTLVGTGTQPGSTAAPPAQ